MAQSISKRLSRIFRGSFELGSTTPIGSGVRRVQEVAELELNAYVGRVCEFDYVSLFVIS
jgi:hypothetical protein